MTRNTRTLLAALSLLLVGLAGTAFGERMNDTVFRRTASAAKRIMGKPGEFDAKLALLRPLGKDDTRRATEIIFAWSQASHELIAKKLAPAVEEKLQDLEKYEAKLEKKHGADGRGHWSDVEKSRYEKRRKAWLGAKGDIDVERRVQGYLASAVNRLTDAEALGWLAGSGVPALIGARAHGPLVEACLDRLLANPPSAVDNAVLGIMQLKLTPAAAMRGLQWVGEHKPAHAAVRLGACITAESPAVKRAAVKVLALLDDRRSVPLLIEGLKGASGLPAAEIEELLQRFTGKRFSADHKAWKRWWGAEGEAWLAAQDAAKRFDPLTMDGGVTFYGIRSPSKRVAFVLDRSGSMAAPAVWHASKTPITGGEGKKSSAGKTRLEVAQFQLAQTVNNLASDAFFNILFYDFNVVAWKPVPNIVPATRKHKAEAQKWFMPLEPGSSTSLFQALNKALDYAEKLDAVAKAKERESEGDERIDTIFLLSDGAPTDDKGKLMTKEQWEQRYEAFKTANAGRVVVHAIGVGQGHNKELMKKIARESGGKYVAVGMD